MYRRRVLADSRMQNDDMTGMARTEKQWLIPSSPVCTLHHKNTTASKSETHHESYFDWLSPCYHPSRRFSLLRLLSLLHCRTELSLLVLQSELERLKKNSPRFVQGARYIISTLFLSLNIKTGALLPIDAHT